MTLLELKKNFNNANLFAHEPSDILNNSITKDELINNNYDLIILCHVLEHLQHPHNYIKRFINQLKPGGLLFIEIPNDNPIFLKTKQAFNSPHITFFDSVSLKNMFNFYKTDITLLDIYTSGLKYKNWARIYNRKHFPTFYKIANYRLHKIMKKENNLLTDIQKRYDVYNNRININYNQMKEGYFLRAIFKRND